MMRSGFCSVRFEQSDQHHRCDNAVNLHLVPRPAIGLQALVVEWSGRAGEGLADGLGRGERGQLALRLGGLSALGAHVKIVAERVEGSRGKQTRRSRRAGSGGRGLRP